MLWKTDDKDKHVPDWDDPATRTEVTRAWKFTKARGLAEKAAEALKAEAEKSHKPLEELSAGKQQRFTIVNPPEFKYLTASFPRIQVSKVGDLDKISLPFGLDSPFMNKVFGMGPNQVEVAANLPKTEIYVVRAIEFTPFDELWSHFTSELSDWSLYNILVNGLNEENAALFRLISRDQDAVSQAWLQRVKAEAQFDDSGMKRDQAEDQHAPPVERRRRRCRTTRNRGLGEGRR